MFQRLTDRTKRPLEMNQRAATSMEIEQASACQSAVVAATALGLIVCSSQPLEDAACGATPTDEPLLIVGCWLRLLVHCSGVCACMYSVLWRQKNTKRGNTLAWFGPRTAVYCIRPEYRHTTKTWRQLFIDESEPYSFSSGNNCTKQSYIYQQSPYVVQTLVLDRSRMHFTNSMISREFVLSYTHRFSLLLCVRYWYFFL